MDLLNHDCGDGPSVFAIFILGFSIIPLAIFIEFNFQPPYLFHIILSVSYTHLTLPTTPYV